MVLKLRHQSEQQQELIHKFLADKGAHLAEEASKTADPQDPHAMLDLLVWQQRLANGARVHIDILKGMVLDAAGKAREAD